MNPWMILLLVGLSATEPQYGVPVREILTAPPWVSNARQADRKVTNFRVFQRGAVESPPLFTEYEIHSAKEKYGSQRYPLRDAIEALPEIDENTVTLPLKPFPKERVALRDAVEHRETPFLNRFDHESIWMEPLALPTNEKSQIISDSKVICHFNSEAAYRQEPFSLVPNDIPDYRCTHLVYTAATLDPDKMIVVSREPEIEFEDGFKAATGLRSRDPGLRILVSITKPIGGNLLDRLTENQCTLRCERLAQSILNFVAKHDFDGVVIDWEHWLEDFSGSSKLKLLLQIIRLPLVEHGFTMAVTQRPEDPVDPEIVEISDFIDLKAWRGSPNNRKEKMALYPAPLVYVARLINKWMDGIPFKHRSKIVVGLPIFAQGYKLQFRNSTEAGAPIVGPGNPGAYTKQADGRQAYYEVCEKQEDGSWQSGRDEEGSYLKRDDQWIGYEEPISFKIKASLVRFAGLGGVSLWSLDLDDFQGICGDPWPMLNTATKAIGFYNEATLKKCTTNGLFSDPDNCSGFYSCIKGLKYHSQCSFGKFFNFVNGRCAKANPKICSPGKVNKIVEKKIQKDLQQRQQNLVFPSQKGLRVVCYLTSWSIYRKSDGKFVPENLDASLCTDIIYAFAGLNADTLQAQSFDPWADLDNNMYERVTSIKGVRVLLGLGGWTDSSGDKYSRLISNRASRRKFIAGVIYLLQKYGFHGLSLDWNYPKCWQSDCRKGPNSDKPNFTKLIQELNSEFEQQEQRLSLAVALSGYKEVIDQAYEVREISKLVDFMSVMTYDYHGAWESTTGHLSPLFGALGDSNPYYNANFTMQYLLSLGAEKSKLLMGIPFYGQAYRLFNEGLTDIGDAATGPGASGEFTNQPGMLAYYEICDRLKNYGWTVGLGPSAHYKDQWVGYDNSESVYAKGEYILQNGFGGASIWTIDLDDFLNRCCVESFPLLKSINRALGRLRTAPSNNCRRPPEPVTPLAPIMTTHSDAAEGGPRPTIHMSTSKTTESTTWPTWTDRPSTLMQETTRTTWPSWNWTSNPTKIPETTKFTPAGSWNNVSWIWSETEATTPHVVSSSKPGTLCQDGEYKADPTNCAKYYRCVRGELKREQCAPGLHWDIITRICDWPNTAKCRFKTGQQPTTSRPSWSLKPGWNTTPSQPTRFTSRPIIDAIPTQESEINCEHGQYYDYPNSCIYFFVCVNGKLVPQQCGVGLNWNNEKSMCDWAFKSPCKKKTNSLLVLRDTESCVPGSYMSLPEDCGSYQACLWGQPQVFHCAPGLHFNKDTRICDWPARANCRGGEPIEMTGINTNPFLPSTTPSVNKPFNTGMEVTTIAPVLTSTLPSAEIDPEKVSPLAGYYKVVCYFTNWAWYRRGAGRYLPEHIDHTLCTHIVYGFAVLDYSELTIKAHDSWADNDNRFYERVVAYKKRGLKVLLALGGWNDSAGDKYSRLVNNPAARKKFIEHAVKFLENYGFDGLDLDWEYPVCWQVDCKKGPGSDKQGFADLVRELVDELKPRNMLLTAAVSPSKKVIDKGYDVPVLAKYLDWIAVMAYDFHGQWDGKTGHVAPLYPHPDDDYYYFNTNYSINYWISKGAHPRKIVMGMPLYGQSFTISDPGEDTKLNVPASAGQAGEFTRAAGFLAYYEICDRIRNRGWSVVRDPENRMGPYAYKGSQWVSFDDPETIRRKAEYVRDMGLGGGMVWALDLDDFRGRCGEGRHPLMHSLQKVLAAPPTESEINNASWKSPTESTSNGADQGNKTTDATTTSDGSTGTVSDDHVEKKSEFKVICYFTNWAWYRQNGGKFLPEDVDTDLCTHVLYGFAVLDGSRLKIKSHDPWADVDNKFYERIAALKAKGIKVIMAIGGWNDSEGDKYSRLVNSPLARRSFIQDVIKFIEKYKFEGLDLDWEYPVCWQVDCNKGPSSDKEGFANLVKELSVEFKPKGLLLSAAVSPSKRIIDEGYDVPTMAKHMDWISVMTYDYHGQWDKKTGHLAPLYQLPGDWEPTFNANYSIHYWMERGAPAKKLVMGAPLYGQSFSLAERGQSGLNAPTYGGGEAGEATRARGFLSYYEICERTLTKDWTVVQDKKRRIGPYAFRGDQWISFDDAKQIKLKAELIKDLGLGGGMVWALDLDDFKNRCECEPMPLLRTMNRVLRNYPDGPLCDVTTDFMTIDADQSTQETTTVQQPIHESTTSFGPTYLPPVTNDSSSSEDVDDSVEIIASLPSELPNHRVCNDNLFISHKEDCSKYFICNFGKITEHSCPNGLYWNKNRCDWPENTNCKDTHRRTNIFLPMVAEKQETVKVVCYLTKWSRERPSIGTFLPEDINPALCTHLVYGLVSLHPDRLTIQSPEEEEQKEFVERILEIKNQTGLRVMLGVGGWVESMNSKFSDLAHSSSKRQRFAQHAAQYVKKHGFDGLDFVWEYPVCWQVDCTRGPSTDREVFTLLMKDLSSTFKPHRMLLSASVSASKKVIDAAYDVPSLAKYLDWVGLMTYDYHGYWEGKTGHIAPLYPYPNDNNPDLNANFSVTYWIQKGMPPEKIVMGVPAYGQSFTLWKRSQNDSIPGFNSVIFGPGKIGKYTRSAGLLAYYEICENVKDQGWITQKEAQARVGPFASKNNQWVSYDDVTNVMKKAELIRNFNLGGGMMWSIDLDDFNNHCGCGEYPLLTALHHGIYGKINRQTDCT